MIVIVKQTVASCQCDKYLALRLALVLLLRHVRVSDFNWLLQIHIPLPRAT